MGKQNIFIKIFKNSQRGQTSVEYILLLVVVVSLASGILNSERFKNLLGQDSNLYTKIISQIEYSYRNSRPGEGDAPDYGQPHPSFYSTEQSQSRFFSGLGKYPDD